MNASSAACASVDGEGPFLHRHLRLARETQHGGAAVIPCRISVPRLRVTMVVPLTI